MTKFIKVVLKNFKGNENLRQRILNEPPKYGTGNPEADEVALRVIDIVYDEAQKYRNIRGGRFRPCFYSYGNHLIDGMMIGSTPEGRLKGDPTSNGVSPSNLLPNPGGPTGPMQTVAKFPPEKISSGVSLNMRFHPNIVQTENGLEAFASLVRTFFELGGMHLQPNVVSTETLRAAQENPDEYRDLVVKVSGYSAYFCDLGKSIQEDIIARTEFGL
jgi:formate C-acetyltransferase